MHNIPCCVNIPLREGKAGLHREKALRAKKGTSDQFNAHEGWEASLLDQ